MTRRRIYWLTVTLLMCAVSVAVAIAVVHWRHTVPLSRCSEVYRQYRDTPGIQAAFIHNKQINDTLRLDMTILVAEDSLAFVELLRDFGKTELAIHTMMTNVVDENSRYMVQYPKEKKELGDDVNDMMVSFPMKHTVAILHLENKEQEQILIHMNVIKSFKI